MNNVLQEKSKKFHDNPTRVYGNRMSEYYRDPVLIEYFLNWLSKEDDIVIEYKKKLKKPSRLSRAISILIDG